MRVRFISTFSLDIGSLKKTKAYIFSNYRKGSSRVNPGIAQKNRTAKRENNWDN
jgi:hypothetical protein